MYVVRNEVGYFWNMWVKLWYKDINRATLFTNSCDAVKYLTSGSKILEVEANIKISQYFNIVYGGEFYLMANDDWTLDKMKARKFLWSHARCEAETLYKLHNIFVYVEVDNDVRDKE
jgi:hypothetical protein